MYKRELFVTLKKGVRKMNKKKLLSGILVAAMLMSSLILPPQTVSAAAEPTEIVLDKSTLGILSPDLMKMARLPMRVTRIF